MKPRYGQTSPGWGSRHFPPSPGGVQGSDPRPQVRAEAPDHSWGGELGDKRQREDRWVSQVPGVGASPSPEPQLPPIAAPQPVSGLSMTSDGNSKMLKVRWAPPSGHWESYNILLTNGSDVLVNQTISRASTQLAFSSLGIGLVPGRLYGAHVTVQSGGLNSTARCSGRLGQAAFQRVSPSIGRS